MPPVWCSDTERTVKIINDADVAVARSVAGRLAQRGGFSKRQQWEIMTAISEAGSNILKFAGEGIIHLRLGQDGGVFFELEAVDHGQGIADIEVALQDGSTQGLTPGEASLLLPPQRKGLGLGLGAIQRLMDQLDIVSASHQGTVVRARKWLEKDG
jgi:serine/threonine-protein kinase RsbT